MASINRGLIERLKSVLKIEQAAVYARIQQVANETMLERPLAALVLAARNNINVQRYSIAEEREQIRRFQIGGGSADIIQNDRPIKSQTAISKPSNRTQRPPKDNSVFVVHGRNETLRISMFAFLRALGLKPLEWSHAVAAAKGANPYIGDILDAAMAKVQAVVVLLSPDDEVHLKAEFRGKNEKRSEGTLQGQARPNVLFEAGLALGRHPQKTLLVQVGKIKPFSDIAGKPIIRLGNDISKRNEVANRLEKIGCKIDRIGSDWTRQGNFSL